MYRDTLKQMEFENFNLPFGEKHNSDNRWVKLARRIPLDEILAGAKKEFCSRFHVSIAHAMYR